MLTGATSDVAVPCRGVLFDADDTLFDYQAAERHALLALAREFSLPGLPAEVLAAYRRHNSALWVALERGEIDAERLPVERFRRLLGELQADPAAARELSERYLILLAQERGLLPGALAAVQALAGLVRLGVVTNGLSAVQRPRIAGSSLASWLDLVLVSQEEGVAKPDPELLLRALRRLGVSPREALFVGDGVSSDMACAARAGVDFCWFNPHRSPVPPGSAPALVISSMTELPPLLEDRLSSRH
jgi:YjjG family noncanonical pyrimidine nucleotidase